MSTPIAAFEVNLESDLSAEPVPQMFSRDGKILVGVGARTVKVWDAKTFALLRSFDIGLVPLAEDSGYYAGIIRNSAVSPDGKNLLTIEGTYSGPKEESASYFYGHGKARLWDLTTGRLRFTLARPGQKPEGEYYNAAFSPDGKIIAFNGATVLGGSPTTLWETSTGKFLRELPYSNHATNLFFSRDGKFLIGGNPGSQWLQWNVATGKMLGKLKSETFFDKVRGANAGNQILGVADDGRTVLRRSARSGKYVAAEWSPPDGMSPTLPEYSAPSEDALAPDGEIFARMEGVFSALGIYSARTGKKLKTFTTAFEVNNSSIPDFTFEFSPDGQTLLQQYNSPRQGVLLWDVATGRLKRAMIKGAQFSEDSLDARLAFSADSKKLLVSNAGIPTLWDVETATLQQSFLKQRGFEYSDVKSPALSADGTLLAGISRWKDYEATEESEHGVLWDVRRNQEVLGNSAKTDWRKDARVIAVASRANFLAAARPEVVEIYNLKTNQLRQKLATRSRWALLFSPDGKTLATFGRGESNLSVAVWDAESGKKLWELSGDQNYYEFRWMFSADGKRLLTNFGHEALQIFDARSGTLNKAATLVFENLPIYAIAASANGKYIAIATSEKKKSGIRFYDAQDFHLLLTLEDNVSGVAVIAFSPDGKKLATRGASNDLKLWRIAP